MPTPVSNDRSTDLSDFTSAEGAGEATSTDAGDSSACGAGCEPSASTAARDEVVDGGADHQSLMGDLFDSVSSRFHAGVQDVEAKATKVVSSFRDLATSLGDTEAKFGGAAQAIAHEASSAEGTAKAVYADAAQGLGAAKRGIVSVKALADNVLGNAWDAHAILSGTKPALDAIQANLGQAHKALNAAQSAVHDLGAAHADTLEKIDQAKSSLNTSAGKAIKLGRAVDDLAAGAAHDVGEIGGQALDQAVHSGRLGEATHAATEAFATSTEQIASSADLAKSKLGELGTSVARMDGALVNLGTTAANLANTVVGGLKREFTDAAKVVVNVGQSGRDIATAFVDGGLNGVSGDPTFKAKADAYRQRAKAHISDAFSAVSDMASTAANLPAASPPLTAALGRASDAIAQANDKANQATMAVRDLAGTTVSSTYAAARTTEVAAIGAGANLALDGLASQKNIAELKTGESYTMSLGLSAHAELGGKGQVALDVARTQTGFTVTTSAQAGVTFAPKLGEEVSIPGKKDSKQGLAASFELAAMLGGGATFALSSAADADRATRTFAKLAAVAAVDPTALGSSISPADLKFLTDHLSSLQLSAEVAGKVGLNADLVPNELGLGMGLGMKQKSAATLNLKGGKVTSLTMTQTATVSGTADLSAKWELGAKNARSAKGTLHAATADLIFTQTMDAPPGLDLRAVTRDPSAALAKFAHTNTGATSISIKLDASTAPATPGVVRAGVTGTFTNALDNGAINRAALARAIAKREPMAILSAVANEASERVQLRQYQDVGFSGSLGANVDGFGASVSAAATRRHVLNDKQVTLSATGLSFD